MDLDLQPEMIILKSILTSFEASTIFWGSWGLLKISSSLQYSNRNQVKLAQIRETQCRYQLDYTLTYILDRPRWGGLRRIFYKWEVYLERANWTETDCRHTADQNIPYVIINVFVDIMWQFGLRKSKIVSCLKKLFTLWPSSHTSSFKTQYFDKIYVFTFSWISKSFQTTSINDEVL